MKKVLFVLLLVIFQFNMITCARILGVFPFSGTSHYILANSLMKGLAEAGHDVTMVSPFEEKNMPKRGSYRNIVLTGFQEDFIKQIKEMDLFKSPDSFLQATNVQNTFMPISEATLNHTNVQKLINSREEFDVVIVEQFMVDGLKIFAHRFNAPLIAFNPMGGSSWVNEMVGNPTPLSYIPYPCTYFPMKMSFTQRFQNVLIYVFNQLINHFYFFPQHDAMLQKYFSNPPTINDLYYNVSLVLMNSHESLHQPIPFVPNMIPIGGFHVQPPKALPKELKELLDNAKYGVIYFSMGSTLMSKDLPAYKRDAFLGAFRKLKQTVLWKWEDDLMPGLPPNVKLSKWLPQQDILAHPNVKLFITHSGLLSTTETVYHGVPILAIPVFGDQPGNAHLAVLSGYALSLPYKDPTFSEEKLSSLLHELLNNPKYKENVMKRSQVFHDRPLKPMENAVYWVEYVIRHKGAPHLRVGGVDLPWYQYHLLDVLAVVVAILLFNTIMFYVAVKKLSSYKAAKSKVD